MNTLTPKSTGGEGRGPAAPFTRFVAAPATACLLFAVVAVTILFAPFADAQGVLTVTPGPTAATVAGTGIVGYTGDNGSATSATLASPSAVAYDSAGDIFLADTANHVVREINTAGIITTIAGTGIEGFSGDNGAATAAQLDTPTGVAVDANGNIYIADSHNNRIRKVSGGTITTIAGTGVAGFSGDAAAATAAQLADPTAVAVDTNGNVYIADTNNQRIRKITGTTISTIAGDGEETFAGDGATATTAVLDSPTGVAVDTAGNVYIADRHNQRIRMVTPTGTISTLAGSGGSSFSGTFAGDGSSAAAAALAKPSGVSVDAAGNIYIADTDNQRIREVPAGGSAINTIIGSGQQGYGGDTNAPSSLNLNMPKSAAVSAAGSVAVADKLNERVRATTLPTLTFAATAVGIVSTAQPVTLTNSGTAPITISAITFTGPFATATGGTCTATPITLAAGASCTQNITFVPTAPGAATGSVVFSGTGIVSQTVLLKGTGTTGSTTTTLTTSATTLLTGQSVTLTATVKPTGAGTPTGTVSFYDGATLLSTPVTLGTGGVAILTTNALPDGSDVITAVYSGDTNFTGSTSNAVTELVEDFSFNISSTAGSSTQSVAPGAIAVFNFNIAPLNGPFNFPVVLSATGLPPGATATFNPSTITLGTTATTFTMSIQTAALARLEQRQRGFELGIGGGAISLALLLLPFGLRRKRTALNMLMLAFVVLLGSGAILGLSGCGGSAGFFGQPQQSYTVTVIGTATAPNGAILQRSTTVTLIVQ